MAPERVHTLVVGGGQAGIAMSEHLSDRGVEHLVLERHRIAERWRSERWDSLVANGPAWHDRFPSREFSRTGPDGFPARDEIVDYFVGHAEAIAAPVRCGVAVTRAAQAETGRGFRVETSQGVIEARNLVAATGPFQRPVIPPLVPRGAGPLQIHSSAYRNPAQLPDGAVLVIGAGSSGAQIADELMRAGRRVFLSVGPHDRPPRRYRGKDFVWWLGVLGKWQATAASPETEHVTISVSGAYGGRTIDFRRFAERGMVLLGRTEGHADGVMHFAPDIARTIERGDANYLSLLDEADAHVAARGLDLPEEPGARDIGAAPACMTDPVLSLDLAANGIGAIVWATGYALDFGWLRVDAFDAAGRPVHDRGVARVPGLFFVGLPFLSNRGSSFIWGVWQDARRLAGLIAADA